MDSYGLIGFPLEHSFSSRYFTAKFEREHIDAEYLNFEIEQIFTLRDVILYNQHLRGLNVTIPYKEQVIPFLHALSPEAEKIGAVNVIKVERRAGDMYYYKLTGYNTDYIGFRDSLIPLLDNTLHKKALILGTGGASKAVAQALTDLAIGWRHVSRKPGEDRFSYDELSAEILSEYTLIINASPVGTFPHVDECPAIPYSSLTNHHLLYDLVYNPEETLFLKRGRAEGATTLNGKKMLHLQAEAAWNIWMK